MNLSKKTYLLASLFLLVFILNAYANPQGESVVAGSVSSFDRSIANTLTVNTSSNNTIINWNSFNIAPNETTRFNQPSAGSAVLNRVVGVDPSSIYGTMSSNGKLFLVNPNGIIFGPGSQVNAPAIVASTLDIANDDFLKGNYTFFKNGGNAYIINQGRLAASPGGYIALLSQAVNNQGVIIADLGSVALAAGEHMTLALDSQSQISVVVDQAVQSEVLGPDGQKITDAINNSGTIQANSGKVVLTAQVLNDVFDYAVNNSGIIEANSVQNQKGSIELTASGAPVINTDTIEADAGQININVPGSNFTNKGKIITDGSSLLLPNGGLVNIQAGSILQQGLVSANAFENGVAGEIDMVSETSTVLDDGSSTEARALGEAGVGGRILIDSTGGSTFVNKTAVIDVSGGSVSGNAGSIDVGVFDQLGFYGILNGRAPPGYNPATVKFTYHSSSAPSVAITTDQEDYHPSGKPIISGSGFLPNQQITLNIVTPDGTQVTLSVVTDAQGSFTYNYTPGSLMGGVYFVTCTDASRSAVTRFTDTVITSTAAGGNWATGSTWVGGVVPGTGDAVVIATTGSGSVQIAANLTQTAAGSVTVNNGATLNMTTTGVSITLGALTIDSGGTVTVYRPLTVLGATKITGTINFGSTNSNHNTMTFKGDITLNSGAVWNETTIGAVAIFSFGGNFTNNATTFTAQNNSTAVHTFTGTSMTFSGITPTDIPYLKVNGTYANDGILMVTSILSGTGSLTNDATGVLNIGGTSTITTLIATTAGNTVNYNGAAAQTVKVTTYYNLILSGSGVKSMASGISVIGNLSIAPTGNATAHVGTGVNLNIGSLTLGGLGRINGTWGGTGSGAAYINAIFFAATTGKLIVTMDTRTTPNLSVTNPPVIYNGSSYAANVSAGSVAGTVSNILTGGAANQTNAGTYKVTADFTPTDTTSYKSLNSASAGNFVINKANATINVTPYSVTYDGNSHTATGTATGVDGVTPLAGLDLSGTTHTNAGANADTWTFTDVTGNYNNASGTVSDPIAKANATINVTPYSVTYDGNSHTATGTATGVDGVTPLAGLDLSGTTHTNAGANADTWTFTDVTGNYNNASGTVSDPIAKANATINVTPYSVTYDGNSHTATGTATGVDGVTPLAGLDLSGTTHTNAGANADTWTFTDVTGNYNNASGTVSDPIAKANATINVTPYSVTYDGNSHTATGTATGVDGVTPLAGLDLSGTTHTNAGANADTWTFTDVTGNYNNASGTVSDPIAKANATINVTPYSVTYDGNSHTATGTATGVDGVTPLAGLDLSGTTHTNAGANADTWTFTDVTGNYNNASGTVSDPIAKANATINVTPYSVTYDGNSHTATGTATGVDGVTPLAGLDLSGTTHTNAGANADTWTFTDVTGNYNNASGTVSDPIAKANATINVTPYSVTYDGNSHTATGTATGVDGVTPLAGLDLSGTTHTNAGANADTWTFTDVTGNYNNASGTVSDPIAAKELTVSGITAANKEYDGTTTATLNTTSAALSGVISGDTVNLVTTGAIGTFNTPAIGTGKTVTVSGLTLSGADAGNYLFSAPQASTTANIVSNASNSQISNTTIPPTSTGSSVQQFFNATNPPPTGALFYQSLTDIDYSAFNAFASQFNQDTFQFIDGKLNILGLP